MNAKVVPLKQKRGYNLVDREAVSAVVKGVPIPAHRGIRYPLAEMQPGDSFTCPFEKLGSVKSNIARFKREHPKLKLQFTHRPEGDGLLRVWRIK